MAKPVLGISYGPSEVSRPKNIRWKRSSVTAQAETNAKKMDKVGPIKGSTKKAK